MVSLAVVSAVDAAPPQAGWEGGEFRPLDRSADGERTYKSGEYTGGGSSAGSEVGNAASASSIQPHAQRSIIRVLCFHRSTGTD